MSTLRLEERPEQLADIDDLEGGMPIWESIRVAWRGLSSNKMRTGLTMLGVIIGVAAVIAMVSMGQGASKSVAASINSLGTNLLTVNPGNPRLRIPGQGVSRLTLEESKTLQTRFPKTIKLVSPEYRGGAAVKMGDTEATTQVIGAGPAYDEVHNATTRAGAFVIDQDVTGRTKVAILGTTVIANLLGDDSLNPIGQTISINRIPFKIVGVLTPKGSGAFGQDQDDVIIIPVSTALRRVFNKVYLTGISIECTSPSTMDLATEEISTFLRQSHNLHPPFPDNDDFNVRSQSSLLETSQSVTGTLTTLLAGVAVVSLVVGGIGIMNIMLVSVTERTREIGLRKAIGATSGDILTQFLIESLVIAMIGGLVGILLGVGASALLAKKMGWATVVDPMIVLLAVAVSGGIGVGFGIYPAYKAAAQSPIEALRYE